MKRGRLKSTRRALVILAVLGFGLLQGARLLDLGSGPYSSEPFAVVGIAAGGFTYLYVAALSYTGRLDEARPLFIGSIVAMALRAGLLFFAPGDGGISAFVAQVAGGVGWALAILCWMQVFASYRPTWAMPMIAVGYFVDMLLVPLTSALFSGARMVAFIVALILSIVALGVCLKHDKAVAERMKSIVAAKSPLIEVAARTKRAIVGTVVFSASCGFIVQMDIVRGLQYAQTDVTSVLGIAVSVLICLVLFVLRPKKADMDLLYPLSAAALMTVLLCRSVEGVDAYLSGPMMVVLLITFFCLLWMSFTSEAYERKLPGFFLLGLAVGSAQLAIASGRLAALTPFGDALAQSTHVVLPAIMWLLSLSVIIIFASYLRVSTKSCESVELAIVDEPEVTPSTSVDLEGASLALLCQTYRLSERECQIVGEYSTGRSVRYIADYLVLSEHTIKSHLRRAYAKMEVHSRQELLNLIDRMETQIHQRF